jgi:GDP-L-fucose synthase
MPLNPALDDARILITGASGMVGSALVRLLKKAHHGELLIPSSKELNLLDADVVDAYFAYHEPHYAFMIAARVGGIKANSSKPVEFMVENMQMQLNLFQAAYKHRTRKNLFMGSSCVYPRECPQPMKEDYLLTGPVEPTNEGYALAKIAGMRLANYYFTEYGMKTVCPIPCNIYGTNDHFDFNQSHVLSALVRRFVDAADEKAEAVTLWGTGVARREFMHVDDAARALLFLFENYDQPDHVNVGVGQDISIFDLAHLIAQLAGFSGKICWDAKMPDGMPRKYLDSTRLTAMGFTPQIGFKQGIKKTIEEYRRLKQEGKIV